MIISFRGTKIFGWSILLDMTLSDIKLLIYSFSYPLFLWWGLPMEQSHGLSQYVTVKSNLVLLASHQVGTQYCRRFQILFRSNFAHDSRNCWCSVMRGSWSHDSEYSTFPASVSLLWCISRCVTSEPTFRESLWSVGKFSYDDSGKWRTNKRGFCKLAMIVDFLMIYLCYFEARAFLIWVAKSSALFLP